MVAFAAVDSDDALLAYVEAGIVGFVPREGSVADLMAAVEGALSGEARLSPRLTGTLMRRLAELGSVRVPETTSSALTRREREILRLIDEGLSNKQIAARLTIELATVKNHVHHILEKTHARVSIGTIDEMQRAGVVIAEVLGKDRPATASTSSSSPQKR